MILTLVLNEINGDNMSDKTLLAVYGSLREGRENSQMHDSTDAVHYFTGHTKDDYDLFAYQSGYFPSVSLAHSSSEKPVIVDVYMVGNKAMEEHYDFLEGYNKSNPDDSFYNRKKVDIVAPTGDMVEAWMYHINEITGQRVDSGDWNDYKEA